MILPVVALLLLAGVLVQQIRAAKSTVGLIELVDRRIALATKIELLVVDEETGLRGYQTTGDARFLDPYRAAQAPLADAVGELQSLVTGQGTNLKAFVAEHQTWHTAFADPLIAIIAAGGQTNDVDLNLTGRRGMDSMRAHLDTIVHTSEQRRKDSIAQWQTQVRDVLLVLVLLALFVGLFLALFTRNRLEAVSTAFRKSLDLQRSRAEELFRSEQHLRTTLASIGDGVITCDAAGNIQMMNLVAQELTGWTESEAQDRPLKEIFHIVDEATRQPVEDPVTKVKRLNTIVALANHTVLIRKDGAELSIDDSGAP